MKAGQSLRINDWIVYPDRNEAERGGIIVRMEPMSVRLLMLLAENTGRTVSRDEIVDDLWGGRVVSEDAITKQISKLRGALGDDPRNPGLIKTIAKKGVRLVAPVEWLPPARPGISIRRQPIVAIGAIAALAVVVAGAALWRSADHELRVTRRPLTSATGLEFDPAISPDGRFIAYAALGPNDRDAAVLVRTTDEEIARRTSPVGVDARSPAWSPNGRLAFVTKDRGGCSIAIGSITGGSRRVAGCTSTLGLAWRGDEQLIVADHARVGTAFRLVSIDLKSGKRRALTNPPAGSIGDRFPVVSGDLRKIYFARSPTVGVQHILSFDLASGHTQTVTEDAAHIVGLAPGGPGRLLVASNRGTGVTALWKLKLANGSWLQIVPEITGMPSATPDGRTIVVAQSDSQSSLWRINLANGAASALTHATKSDWLPAIAHDGSVAFLSNRSGAPELWVVSKMAGEPQRLTRLGGAEIQDPAWSPDSKTVAIAVPKASDFDLYLVNVQGRTLLQITKGRGDDRHPSFSPDGRILYFSRRLGSHYTLMRKDVASGREISLGKEGLRSMVSDDGRTLYFGRLFTPGLFKLSLTTGAVTRLTPWPAWGDMRNWALADGKIFVVARTPDKRAILMQVDPATGVARKKAEMPLMGQPSGIALRKDGVIYSKRLAAQSDLALLHIEAE